MRNSVVRLAGWIAMIMALPAFGINESTMKAIVIHKFGGPEVLNYEDATIPVPKDDEMLVKVVAAGVNSFDGVLRSGKYEKIFKMKLPWIPGYDIAGTVEKVGGNISKFHVGDPAFQHIGILSLEFHVDKLSRPLL